MRDEALDNYLKNLVDEGKITQEQADQYKSWWQSKPDIGQDMEQCPGMPPAGPFERFGGHGFQGGMGWGEGQTPPSEQSTTPSTSS